MKEIKTCEWCKKRFETARSLQHFCDKECEQNYHKAKKRLASHFIGSEWSEEMRKLENEGKSYVSSKEA